LPAHGQGKRQRIAEQDAKQNATRRMVTWLTWWVLMMSLWVAVDDSVRSDELLAGLGLADLPPCGTFLGRGALALIIR
jgi:hypothetical protein